MCDGGPAERGSCAGVGVSTSGVSSGGWPGGFLTCLSGGLSAPDTPGVSSRVCLLAALAASGIVSVCRKVSEPRSVSGGASFFAASRLCTGGRGPGGASGLRSVLAVSCALGPRPGGGLFPRSLGTVFKGKWLCKHQGLGPGRVSCHCCVHCEGRELLSVFPT